MRENIGNAWGGMVVWKSRGNDDGTTYQEFLPMPNTELIRLMEISAIHEDDRPEVERIFACLTEERRITILADWPKIAERIKRNREAVEEQKCLLLANAVSWLAQDLSAHNHEIVARNVRNDLEEFKKSQNRTP